MSASSSQGSSWLDIAVPIGPASTSGAQQQNTTSFNDGSFTFASSPTPGLTAGLSNVSSGVAALGQGFANALTGGATSALSGLLPVLLIGGLVWFLIEHHGKK